MNSTGFWRDADKRFYVARHANAFTGERSITPNSLSIVRLRVYIDLRLRYVQRTKIIIDRNDVPDVLTGPTVNKCHHLTRDR